MSPEPIGEFARNIGSNFCRSQSFDNWLMKVKDTDWRINRKDAAVAILAASANYDGIFYDLLGTAPLSTTYNYASTADGSNVSGQNGWPVDPDTSSNYTAANYRQDVGVLLGVTASAISPKLVAGNGLQTGSEYFAGASVLFNDADYLMAEIFIRGPYDGITTYRSEALWKQDVDMIVDSESHGNTVLCMTKVWVAGTTAQIDQWHRYALATYYLGARDFAMFSFRKDHQRMHLHRYWTPDPGRPASSYVKLASGLYYRAFTSGAVYVNPTATAITVNLGGAFDNLEGVTITTLTLAGHDGAVLSPATGTPAPTDTPPTAGLTVTKVSLVATANAGSSTAGTNPITSYTFSWGDASADTGPQSGASASHTYASSGTYTVTVTVYDDAGNQDSTSRSVTVSGISGPVPALTLTTSVLTATADASGSTAGTYPIATYTFGWGDAATTGPQAGSSAAHTYSANGRYVVTLTVIDTQGNVSSLSRAISIGVALPPAGPGPSDRGRIPDAGLGTYPSTHQARYTPHIYLGGSTVTIHDDILATEGWFVGEDKTLVFSVDEDITGWDLEFVLMRNLDGAVLLTKTTGGGSITATGPRVAEIAITGDETTNLPEDVIYRYSLSRTDVNAVLANGAAALLVR